MLDLFERARAVSALDVARREGLSLQRKGQRWWMCCPIHGEKTASLVFDDAGRYHCFGCGAGGDAVDLISRMQGITPLDAVRQLDTMFGLHLFDKQPDAEDTRLRARAAQTERDKLNAFEAWVLWAGNVLAAYLRTLDGLRRDLEPQGPDCEIPPIFGWVCRETNYWETLYLGAFVNGGFREQVELYRDCREGVQNVARVLTEAREGCFA